MFIQIGTLETEKGTCSAYAHFEAWLYLGNNKICYFFGVRSYDCGSALTHG